VAAGLSSADGVVEAQRRTAPGPDASERDLALLALDAARSAGAVYADARVIRVLSESINTRERQITNVTKSESYGIGVRAFVGGSWGFSATSDLTRDAVAKAAREAVAIATANDRVAPAATRLAPVPKVPDGRWITPHVLDPFTVPLESKAQLLFRINEEALKVKGVRFVTSSADALKESRLLATTDGSLIQQTFIRVSPNVNVTAVAADNSDSQTRSGSEGPMGAGWEYVTGLELPARATRYASEAVAKLSAPAVEPGSYDLVLHPSHLWLTVHESIAHPSELDRALGYEANYAGTTFLAPPEKVLGKFRLGQSLMTFVANRTEAGGNATVGWDDEGVPATSYPIVDKGLFVSYQSATREMIDAGGAAQQLQEDAGACLRTDVGIDPVSAHAEREPAAGGAEHQRGGGAGGHGPRHLHRGRRLVLDRSAALQLPVRRPDVLGGHQGQEDADAARRRLRRAHARLLELDGDDWRA
jgi:TldD protein